MAATGVVFTDLIMKLKALFWHLSDCSKFGLFAVINNSLLYLTTGLTSILNCVESILCVSTGTPASHLSSLKLLLILLVCMHFDILHNANLLITSYCLIFMASVMCFDKISVLTTRSPFVKNANVLTPSTEVIFSR